MEFPVQVSHPTMWMPCLCLHSRSVFAVAALRRPRGPHLRIPPPSRSLSSSFLLSPLAHRSVNSLQAFFSSGFGPVLLMFPMILSHSTFFISSFAKKILLSFTFCNWYYENNRYTEQLFQLNATFCSNLKSYSYKSTQAADILRMLLWPLSFHFYAFLLHSVRIL